MQQIWGKELKCQIKGLVLVQRVVCNYFLKTQRLQLEHSSGAARCVIAVGSRKNAVAAQKTWIKLSEQDHSTWGMRENKMQCLITCSMGMFIFGEVPDKNKNELPGMFISNLSEKIKFLKRLKKLDRQTYFCERVQLLDPIKHDNQLWINSYDLPKQTV